MAGQAQTLQLANPAAGTVSRAPQTTAAPTGGGDVPFARLSREGSILGPASSGNAFGALLTPTLKPVGGYLKSLTLTLVCSGGSGTSVVATADAPYNVIQNLFLRDPYGQPIVQASGYGIYLLNLYGGQTGMLGFGNNPAGLPNYSAVSGTTGGFTVQLYVPLQLDSSGYCSLPSQNAASQPQIQIQLNPSASVYTSGMTTPGTVAVSIDEPYWMAPVDNPQVGPPDVGSSAQWSEARAAAGIGSAAYQRVVLPRVGTFIHTLILTLRDATGARLDAWPTSDLSLWVDGVPIIMETFAERVNIMYAQFGVTRPTGVLVYSFRDAVQSAVSGADTYDKLLPTTPATLLEIAGTFGTISSAPGSITALTGELFPAGGIPYTHLAS